MKNGRVVLLVVLVFLFEAINVFASDGVFQKPTEWNYRDEQYSDGTTKRCRYGDPCDGRGKSTPYHTGIDYQQDDGSDNVYAAAEGKVVRIQHYGQEISGGIYEDHMMGNVVILKHYCANVSDCPPGGKVYTLYAHMQSFNSNLSVGDWVHKGDVLGVIGGSENDCLDKDDTNGTNCRDNAWPRHLHFEVKKAPVLYEASSNESCMRTVENWRTFYSLYAYKELSYGYSPNSDPNGCGYFDPDDFIGNVIAKDLSIQNTNNQLPAELTDGSTDGYGITGFGYTPIPTDSPTSGLPDFIITNLKLTDSGEDEHYTFNATDTMHMHAYAKNVGDANWAAFSGEDEADDIYVKFYLSNGYKEDAHSEWNCVGTQQIKKGNLNVGETKHESDDLNLSGLDPGVYNIVACVDRKYDQNNGDGEVPEMHKSNNCSTEAVFVIKEPNLKISEFSAGKTEVHRGEQVHLSAYTVNDGGDVHSDIKLRWFISTGNVYNNPTLIEEDNMQEGNLKAGDQKFEDATFTAPTTVGKYTLSVLTDSSSTFSEVNENDNWAHLTINVVEVTQEEAAILMQFLNMRRENR